MPIPLTLSNRLKGMVHFTVSTSLVLALDFTLLVRYKYLSYTFYHIICYIEYVFQVFTFVIHCMLQNKVNI